MQNQTETKYYSVKSAAQYLGLKSLCYTRKIMGEPDARVKSNERERFLYCPEHVSRTKAELENKRRQRIKNRGMRCCYQCREKYFPDE